VVFLTLRPIYLCRQSPDIHQTEGRMVHRSVLEVLERRTFLVPFGIKARRLVVAQTEVPQESGAIIAFLLTRSRVLHVGISDCRK
jgi:hypothetical protein